MNKEEFIDTLQACYFGDRGAFNKIVKEYEELHNKINKAIEYIEENKIKSKYCRVECGFDTYIVLNENEINELLEILKDSDVDDN